MSGASIQCCRICGAVLKRSSDYDESRLLESSEECTVCNLYRYEYAYGNYWERIGVVEWTWDYTENRTDDWRKYEAEAKLIYASMDGLGHLKAMRDHADQDTPRLMFADWLDDNDCPLNAAYLRSIK